MKAYKVKAETIYQPNVTVVGSPTVNNNIVGGFSASNYLIFPESFPSATSAEFLFKVNMSNYHGDWNVLMIPFNTNAPIGFSSAGKLSLYNTSAWLQGATTYSTGVDIWIKLIFDGTSWKLYGLIDNSYTNDSLPALSNWSLEITWNTTTNPWQGSVYIAHSYKDTNEYFGGYIDLAQSYIKINGETFWAGIIPKEINTYKAIKANPIQSEIPNVTVVGSPTIKDGIVSGFSTSNYLVIPNSYKSNNATYVFKFTTDSTFSTHQVFAHGEFLLNLEITTGKKVQFYNWGSKSSSTLFEAKANTTYWVKIVINGTTKTYSYSTNGKTFTGDITITDSGINTSNTTYQFRLGLSSYNSSGPFLGSIDLKECYIDINDVRAWNGTNSKIRYRYYTVGD